MLIVVSSNAGFPLLSYSGKYRGLTALKICGLLLPQAITGKGDMVSGGLIIVVVVKKDISHRRYRYIYIYVYVCHREGGVYTMIVAS